MTNKVLVVYTDGAAKPNPGYGGWGLHGYLCEKVAPKKGAGLKNHVLTDEGYRSKLDAKAKTQEVTPIEYYDMSGAIPPATTNNVGEMKGILEAMKLALDKDVQKLYIISDSRFALAGVREWIDKWKKTGWVKSDGNPLANVDLWHEISRVKDELKEKNVEIGYQWVKGHGDDPGNILADKLSVLGRLNSFHSRYVTVSDKRPPEGYWKIEVERNPLLDFPGILFNTLKGYNTPGLYYMTNKVKEDEFIGTPTSETAYGIVKLKTPEPIVEFLRNTQSRLADNGERDLLVLLRMGGAFKPDVHKDIIDHGESLIRQATKSWDLVHETLKEPITRILNPPKLAMQAIDELSHLAVKLEEYENKDTKLTVTDLTSLFYDEVITTNKKKEEVKEFKLKEEFIVGFSKLDVTVNYKVSDQIKQSNLILTFGIDIINRNALKRIESEEPKISVVTWMESDLMFRYATIIQTRDDISIWAGVCSNLKLLLNP